MWFSLACYVRRFYCVLAHLASSHVGGSRLRVLLVEGEGFFSLPCRGVATLPAFSATLLGALARCLGCCDSALRCRLCCKGGRDRQVQPRQSRAQATPGSMSDLPTCSSQRKLLAQAALIPPGAVQDLQAFMTGPLSSFPRGFLPVRPGHPLWDLMYVTKRGMNQAVESSQQANGLLNTALSVSRSPGAQIQRVLVLPAVA